MNTEKFNLKIGFILLLLFSVAFHFVLPYVYFEIQGFQSNYQFPDRILYERSAYHTGLLINVLALLGAAIIIWFLPLKAKKITPIDVKWPHLLYTISIAWGIYFVIMAGGFQGVLAGKMLGTYVSYVGLF